MNYCNLQDSIPMRVKGVHVVNQPYIFNMVFALFKPFLREKLKSRVSWIAQFTSNCELMKKSIFRFTSTERTATLCSSILTRKHYLPVIRENSKFLESLAQNGTVFCVSWTRSILVNSLHKNLAFFLTSIFFQLLTLTATTTTILKSSRDRPLIPAGCNLKFVIFFGVGSISFINDFMCPSHIIFTCILHAEKKNTIFYLTLTATFIVK